MGGALRETHRINLERELVSVEDAADQAGMVKTMNV
jgi:hypothetical protein